MAPTALPPQLEPYREKSAAAAPACPICNGALIHQGWNLRCSRCQFSLCEGCEGGPVEVPEIPDW
jgi:hypothetical protein